MDEVNNNKVLCGDRLTQMTKTYNDIEAVTRLLEEKERDLELAAKIGQTLLEKNKFFEEKNEELDQALNQANERLHQLKHDLSMKDELLKIYTHNYDSGELSSPETPGDLGPHVPSLEKKIKTLEDDNLQLHLETSKLKVMTQELEDKEEKLVNDCLQQLEDIHKQRDDASSELAEKTEECAGLKEENTTLLHQIVAMQKKVRTLTADNMELQKTLEAAYDSQNYLSREIADLKEKNEELLALLEETQEELRRFRSRERPGAMRHSFMSPLMNTTGESLASELENSMRSEVDYPKGYSSMERKKHTWKIFETAKAAKTPCRNSSAGSCSASMLGASLSENDDSRSVSQRSSMYFSDTESGVSEGCPGDLDSLYGGSTRFGRPGVPGSSDLQRALRRLSMRRANELNEMDYAKEERERQHREEIRRDRSMSEMSERSDTESQAVGRCRSPDSTISANSGYLSMTGSSGNPYYKMPEKLRIVKPLEGSITLRQWQRLATPHLGGIFETRPGVRMKGEAKLTLGTEATEDYTLSDYEEDDEVINYPTRFQESSGVFTLTDSRVKHPSEAASDVDMETESVSTLEDQEMSTSFTSSTPRMAAVRQTENFGTSTYSMSLGLASLLNERDLQQESTDDRLENSATSIMSDHCSNPARFPSLVSEMHFSVGNLSSPTSTLTLPTNSYNLIPSPSTLSQRSERGLDLLGSRSQHSGHDTNELNSECVSQHRPIKTHDAKPSESGNGDSSALSVINKLKNTGFSLYGYITGGGAVNGGGDNVELSRPNSLPLTSTSVSLTSVSNSGSNAVTLATGSASLMATGSANAVGLASAGMPTTSSTPVKSHLASILNRKTAGGVIGALTQLRRDGAL